MPMGQLAKVLREANPAADRRLLVGPQTLDDAGVILLGEEEGVLPGSRVALVQTVDYFPPVLDDPYAYGAVAAANALSDVYAMGARPLSALNLAGFPTDFDPDWIAEIFRGGFDKLREADAVLAGGHTVQGPEPLFGFAVTGVVDPARVITNAGAQAGDRMYLTKPLGMGSLTTAGKRGKAPEDLLQRAATSMATLNRAAGEAMMEVDARACTDITGFGLLGHAHNIARASGVTLSFSASALPIFEGALALARDGIVSGGSARSKAAIGDDVSVDEGVDPDLVRLTFDAETSGGLLICVPAEQAGILEQALQARDVPVHLVGEVLPAGDHSILLN